MPSPCQWVRSVLAAWLDGELKVSTAEAVRRHLEQCESCRAHARLLKESWRLLDEMPPAPVRSGFTGRMMARLVEEKELNRLEARLEPRRRRRQVVASVLGLAAGLILGLVLHAWTGLPEKPKSPIEREVSLNVSFLEDADLMDEIAVIEAMDRLMSDNQPDEGV